MFKIIKVIVFSMMFSSIASAHGWEHHHFGNGYNHFYGGGMYYRPQIGPGYYPVLRPYFPPQAIVPNFYVYTPGMPVYGYYRRGW